MKVDIPDGMQLIELQEAVNSMIASGANERSEVSFTVTKSGSELTVRQIVSTWAEGETRCLPTHVQSNWADDPPF